MAGPLAQGLLAAKKQKEQATQPGLLSGLSLSPVGPDGMRVPPLLQGILDSAISGATFPGDVYAGRADPTDYGRALDTAGMVTLGAAAFPGDPNDLRMGIKAYHGSPYDFEKFDIAKVGTGEGAQDLGRAIYLYDERAPAELYRNPASRWGDTKAMENYAKKGPSRVYEVNIDAPETALLDTETLLKDLPDGSNLKEKLKERVEAEKDPEYAKIIAENMKVKNLAGKDGFEEAVKADGYKGVTRSKFGGEKEIAVLDPEILTIVKKYGIIGALFMGAITMQQASQLATEKKRFDEAYAQGKGA